MLQRKAQHAKPLELKRKSTWFDAHAARVEQYKLLNLLGKIAGRIDDLHYENFHVPILLYQERVLRDDCLNAHRANQQPLRESAYIDARHVHSYGTPDFPLRCITSTKELKCLIYCNQAFQFSINEKTIPSTLLKRALNDEQLRFLHQECEEVVELSEIQYGDGVPEQLRVYNKKLSKADLIWGHYQRLAEKSNVSKSVRRAAEERSESLYEKALEHLEEFFDCAKRGDFGPEMPARLQSWMDRPLDFDEGVNRALNINAREMPRVRGSKSLYAMDSGLPKLSKKLKQQYCALRVLLVAACEIAFLLPEQQAMQVSEAETDLLRKKLRGLKTKNSN